MSRVTLALCAALALAPLAGATAADFKNLQVLPKNISKDDLRTLMRAQSKALGVECDFCHQMPDAEKDTDHKKIARDMMRMTNEINAKFFKTSKVKVTCATCHRGKEEPDEVGK